MEPLTVTTDDGTYHAPCRWTYQAISTRYKGPTNTRGSRIIATADAGRMVVSYEDHLSPEAAHRAAAMALARKYGWTGTWYAGATREGYVFVRVLPGMVDPD